MNETKNLETAGAAGGSGDRARIQADAPGGLDAAWQEERETVGRPFWAVPLVLSVWAIAVPLGMSLWSDDEVGAIGAASAGSGNREAGQLQEMRQQTVAGAGQAVVSCEALALHLAETVELRDTVAAAHAGYVLGRQGCSLGAAPGETF